jgi:hypothetical protein
MKANSRRNFLATTAILGTSLAVSASGLTKPKKKQLVHHVFFWLKNPDSKEDLKQLIEGLRTLEKIETVNQIHIGVLASTEKREVVDTSWQVSELLFFDDLEGQLIYQKHPIHLAFAEKYSHLLTKIVVYDASDV